MLSLKFNMRIYIATRSYNIVSGNEARGNSYALTSDGTVVVTVCRERYFYRLDRLLVFFYLNRRLYGETDLFYG